MKMSEAVKWHVLQIGREATLSWLLVREIRNEDGSKIGMCLCHKIRNESGGTINEGRQYDLTRRWYIKAFLDGIVLVHRENIYDIQRGSKYEIMREVTKVCGNPIDTIEPHIDVYRRKPIWNTFSANDTYDFFAHLERKYGLQPA